MQPETNLRITLATGHTGSSALAMDDGFRAITAVQGLSFYLHAYPPDVVAFRAGELLSRLGSKLGLGLAELQRRTKGMVICVAGGAKRRDQEQVRDFLDNIHWKSAPSHVTVVDDTWSGLVAGTTSYFGTCAFAGTGASVFVGLGKCPLTDHRGKFDGWGSIIGDFGSAFQLSVDLFRSLNRHYDKTGKAPPLFKKILEACPDIESIQNVQRWFDAVFISEPHEWRLRLATLARVVTAEADRPKPKADGDAVRLINSAARQMAKTLEIAILRNPRARRYPVVFQGGMFEHSQRYRAVVLKRCRRLTSGGFALAKYRPIIGATLMFPDMRPEHAARFFRSISLLPDSEIPILVRNNHEAGILRPKRAFCYG
jgi:N-acetylglucosamine kinase-like BadF-type ATPase